MSTMKLALILEAIDRITDPVSKADKSVRDFVTRVDQSAARLKALSQRMEACGREALIAGAAITAGGVGIMKSFADLENAQAAAQNAFSTLTGLDRAWDSINRQAIKAGDLYPGTTADFINLAAAMKRMGMEASTVESGAVQGAAALKVMFDLNPAQAGEQFVQMTKALTIAGRDSHQFADAIQRTSYAAGLSLAEITDAMQYIGAPLKSLHMANGLEDAKNILATMGVLKQSGLSGSMIGTAIEQSLSHLALVKPKLMASRGYMVGAVGDALRRGGIKLDFFDEKGNSKGFMNVLAQLDKLNKLSAADRSLVGKTHFGEQGARMAELVNLDAFRAMQQRMTNQEDLEKRLARITKTLGNTFEAMGGTAKNVAALIGEKVAPTLKGLMERTNALLSRLGEFINRHPVLVKWITLTVGALGVLLVSVGGVLLITAKLVSLFASSLGILARFVPLLGSAAVAVKGFAAAFLATPLGWIVAVVAAVIGIGVVLWKNWDRIAAWFKRTFPDVHAAFASAWAGMKEALVAFWVAIKPLLVMLWGSFTTAWKAMMEALKPVFVALQGLWEKFKPFLSPVFKALALAVLLPLAAALVVVGGALYLVIKAITWLVKGFTWLIESGKKLMTWLTGFGTTLHAGGANLVKSLAKGMMSAITHPVDAIKAVVAKIRRFLPFSPAKEGPLADLHRLHFMETIANSIHPSVLFSKLHGIASHAMAVMKPVAASVLSVPLATGTALTSGAKGSHVPLAIHVEQHLHFPPGSAPADKQAFLAMLRDAAPETARLIADELKRQKRSDFS